MTLPNHDSNDTPGDPTREWSDFPAERESGAAALSDADARALDALVDAGFDLDALRDADETLRERARRLKAQFALLDEYPDEARSVDGASRDESLVDATLACVDREEAARAARLRLTPTPAPGRRGLRMSDLVAAASIAILGTSVLVPVANWATGRSLETRCANNLRLASQGIEAYGQDFGSLPYAASLMPDLSSTWAGMRNSENLVPLQANHYCGAGSLCCPGDHDPNGRYAYLVLTSQHHPKWNQGPRIVLLGDRNPLVDLTREGKPIGSVTLNSASHGGHGQNLLFSDGSVDFADSPYLDSAAADAPSGTLDNIWLPFGNSSATLFDNPRDASPTDVFLVH